MDKAKSERPPKPPGKNWPKAFHERHEEVQARRVKALDWNRHEKNIYDKVVHWFEVIKRVLDDPAVLAENVYNMDETGVMLSMLGSTKVLRVAVTAVECQYALSDSGYTDSYISLQWLKLIFDPETKAQATHISGVLKPRVLICDGFETHETLKILEFCLSNNIILCRLPSHTSHKLQPCDVSTFAPLKAAYRDQVERLERGGVNKIGKEHFTSLYSPARIKAFTPRNIKAGFAACGLFPFNPDRVLNSMPKPPEPITSDVNSAIIGPC
ncbi:DDE-domain-containing protein [Amniculicola lignicola CBS 123094]|uniref:DDE-domain-containing protein n=1 Tax=Amniculicola lignicola CBS 123094 TaxID=1392246 RepID=A0A6A5WTL9_9PLEO|nr:DDE-domain-containing protein [Amniculicola lignicola CBS 123094]